MPLMVVVNPDDTREDGTNMKYRVIVLAGLLVGLANLALAQGLRYESYYNWNFLGAGARARAMGGAFLAVSDDGSAATWNPAGLPYNEGILTSMNWNLVFASVENNLVGFGEASGDFGNVGYWSFIAPVTLHDREFVGAITYNRLQDIFYEDGIVPRQFVANELLTLRMRSVGGLTNINLGFGTEVRPNLTFGAGVNIAGGDRKDSHNILILYEDRELSNGVERQEINVEADVDYSGFHGNFGLLYRTDTWSAGLVYSTAWVLTEQLDYKSGVSYIQWGIPQPAQVFEALFITERKIDIPYSIGLGGSYRPSEHLLIALDYQFRKFKNGNYSTQQELYPELDVSMAEGEVPDKGILSPASDFTDYPTKWYNLHQIRLGAEYTLETGYGRIPLRVGFHNVPMVAGNTSGTTNYIVGYYLAPVFDVMAFPGSSDDQNMGFGFTFGAGIHWSQIHLDFSFELETSSSTDQGSYWLAYYGYSEEEQRNAFQRQKITDYEREYKHSQSRFSLNFTGYF